MNVEYDPAADAMYIRLLSGDVVESDEVKEGVILDYDADGRVVGIEILDASRRADNPREMAFEILAA
jgi:uncharacterized protein YuzE